MYSYLTTPRTNYHRFHNLYVRIFTTKYSNMTVHAQKARNIFTYKNYYKINYVKEHDSRFPFANERNTSLKSGCFQSEFVPLLVDISNIYLGKREPLLANTTEFLKSPWNVGRHILLHTNVTKMMFFLGCC